MLLAILLLLTIWAALLALVWRWSRSWIAVAIAAVLLVLATPLPAGHSITILGERLFHEANEAWEQRNEEREQRIRAERPWRELRERILVDELEPLRGAWARARTKEGEVFLDRKNDLVWLPPVPLATPPLDRAVELGHAACQERGPGRFAVASVAERMLAHQAGGDPELDRPGTLIMTAFDNGVPVPLPSVHLGPPGKRAHGHVLCVGLGPHAPEGGYSSDDVPREALMAWQMQRLAAGG